VQTNEDVIRSKYGAAAKEAAAGRTASCGCDCSPVNPGCCDPITSNLYGEEASTLPEAAQRASLGCGNPVLLADLQPGEAVLDLGSGGGIDVLLSAKRVGPGGKAYGLDMTDEMLDLARANQRAAGVENVEFLRGTIEKIPLPDASIDTIISNCVINLSGDKHSVLAEAFRVLRPGGRLAVSDIVTRGALPEPVRQSMELWAGCVAGALDEAEYRRLLADAGFRDISIEVTREYSFDDARSVLEPLVEDVDRLAKEVAGRLISGFIRAKKPA